MTTSESALPQPQAVSHTPIHQRLLVSTGNLYCRLVHRSISWPVLGKYRCWKCLREFDLEW